MVVNDTDELVANVPKDGDAIAVLTSRPSKASYTVRAETITELILERAGPVILKTFILTLIAFRLIPVICSARKAKPETTEN